MKIGCWGDTCKNRTCPKNISYYVCCKEACYEKIKKLNQNKENKNAATKKYTRHYNYLNDTTYGFIAKILSP